jgi:hypothetical protein
MAGQPAMAPDNTIARYQWCVTVFRTAGREQDNACYASFSVILRNSFSKNHTGTDLRAD